ncbi:MAG: type II toxin-antitoxin system Phd/YefM family antitoxin [Herpetosiphonaceae bacterium]|nr:type II toxin-antitoxin system Phd/YefM family antitoxin [Herpetosiphonaceae bacterium]
MPKQYSIADARDNLARIVHDVEHNAPVELTRRGETVAVLLSRNEYARLTAGPVYFWDAFQAFARETNLAALNIGDEDFANLRDVTPGRDMQW